MSENAEKLGSLNKRKKLFELGFTAESIGKLKKEEIDDIINKNIKASDFRSNTGTSKNELTINKNQGYINRKNMDRYTHLNKLIEEDIAFYQGQDRYKDKNMKAILEQAYDSGDPKKFLLKNHNIIFGSKREGGIGPTPAGLLETLPILRGYPSGNVHPSIFQNMKEASNLKKEIDKQLGIISGNNFDTKMTNRESLLNQNQRKVDNSENNTLENTFNNRQKLLNQY